jgi:isoleucyl-tRNA synthetase
LGFKSKKDIEKYGIDKFVEKCKERVRKYSKIQTEQSMRLGQWMDWENSYFTFSDTNIEYIWRFLRRMHDEGYLVKGHRSTEWCPRCAPRSGSRAARQLRDRRPSLRPLQAGRPPGAVVV